MVEVLFLSNVNRAYPGFEEARSELEAAGYAIVDPGARFVPDREVATLIAGVDGVLVGGTHQLRAAGLRAAHRLQVVVREGIGVDNIDVDEATTLGVAVGNTAGSNAASVADHAFALILALARELPRLDQAMREGRGWQARPPLQQIGGRTIGIVGTGNVGHAMVRRASGFGMTILAVDLIPDPALAADHGVRYVDLDTLLADSEIVSLHVPLTALTRGMIGATQLARMRPDALLINTARGEVIDVAAVAAALRGGRLRGLGMDAWPDEPVVDSDLFACPNVIATPHVGGNSPESSRNARIWGARNLRDALDGRPRDLVNPEVLASPARRLRLASDGPNEPS